MILRGIKIYNRTSVVKEFFAVYFIATFFTFNKSVQEGVISEMPVTLEDFYGWTAQEIGFFMLAITPFTMFCSLFPNFLASKGFKVKSMMIVTAFTTLIGCVIKINYKYNEDTNLYFYLFASSFLLSSTLAVEAAFVMLLGTITPAHINASFWSAGMLSGLGDTFGRALGNTEISIFGEVDGIPATTFWLYVFQSVVYVLFFTFALITFRLYEKREIIDVKSNLVKIGKRPQRRTEQK